MSAPRAVQSVTFAHYELEMMTPPCTPTKPPRIPRTKPTSPHLSRAERHKERRIYRRILKRESAKHRLRLDERCEEDLSKSANKKARKATKAKFRANKHVVGAEQSTRHYATISRAPSIFNPTPKTAKAIADAVQCYSPSHYTHKLGTPLRPTLSQGGDCNVERSLTKDFQRVREAIARDATSLSPTPNSTCGVALDSDDDRAPISDETEGQASGYDLTGPATTQHGAYLEFFGNPAEGFEPQLMALDSRSDIEATRANHPKDWNKLKRPSAQCIKRESHHDGDAFGERGRKLRALGYSDYSPNVSDARIERDTIREKLDVRAMPYDCQDEKAREVIVISDDENDSDVEELPFTEFSQEDAIMIELDDEDDVYDIEASKYIVDLTGNSDMEEIEGNGCDPNIVAAAREPAPSRVTDLTLNEGITDESEEDPDIEEIAAPTAPNLSNRFGDTMEVTGDEGNMQGVNAPVLALTATESVNVATGSSYNCPQIIEDSEEVHEAKLELSLQQELHRTQERRIAETREASRLEQLLALEHSSLVLSSLSGELADVRDAFQFICAMRAEQSDLNAKASILEKDMKALMASDRASDEDRTRAEILAKLWYANETAAMHLVLAENKFRDRACKKDPRNMRVLLEAMKVQILGMFERYDARLEEFKASLGGEMRL